MKLGSKINKLLMALKQKGYVFMLHKEQNWSSKLNRVSTLYKLFHLVPVEEYNKLYPDKKKDPNKYDYVKMEVYKSFKQVDILLELVERYKGAGEEE